MIKRIQRFVIIAYYLSNRYKEMCAWRQALHPGLHLFVKRVLANFGSYISASLRQIFTKLRRCSFTMINRSVSIYLLID